MLGLCVVVGCTLGDPSQYGRGDVGPGSEIGPIGNDDDIGAGSSSSGGPGAADAAVEAGSGSDAGADGGPDASVVCTDFAPPAAGAWVWVGGGDYRSAGPGQGEELKYVVVPQVPAFDLSTAPDTSCAHCVQWIRDGKTFFHRSGISTQAYQPPCPGGISATITDLILQEVRFEGGQVVPVAGGACLRATAPVSVQVQPFCRL